MGVGGSARLIFLRGKQVQSLTVKKAERTRDQKSTRQEEYNSLWQTEMRTLHFTFLFPQFIFMCLSCIPLVSPIIRSLCGPDWHFHKWAFWLRTIDSLKAARRHFRSHTLATPNNTMEAFADGSRPCPSRSRPPLLHPLGHFPDPSPSHQWEITLAPRSGNGGIGAPLGSSPQNPFPPGISNWTSRKPRSLDPTTGAAGGMFSLRSDLRLESFLALIKWLFLRPTGLPRVSMQIITEDPSAPALSLEWLRSVCLPWNNKDSRWWN